MRISGVSRSVRHTALALRVPGGTKSLRALLDRLDEHSLSPETAGMAAVPLVMLPFFSSAIVPAEKMGAGLRQFAEYQPFTPIIETMRGLLHGAPDTTDAAVAVVWCVVIALVATCGRVPRSRSGHDLDRLTSGQSGCWQRLGDTKFTEVVRRLRPTAV